MRAVSLDELVFEGELPPPDCIKIDIEGAEMLALRGAQSMLSRYRPSIFLAAHGSEIHRECCRFLGSLKYELRPIGSTSLDQADEIMALGQEG